MTPDKAFILAAGHGKRLRPYTENIPKPMVKIGHAPLIDQTLEKLAAFGIKDCIINTHYKADILHNHLKTINAPTITLSHEEHLLDTGGGIKKALHHFDKDFFVISGDALWDDPPKGQTILQDLANTWDPERMDILMALQPCAKMILTQGVGDYTLRPDGRAIRALDKSGTAMFTSIRINAPHIFDDAPDGPFSYLDLMDQAERKGRLYGRLHQGDWHHISTPKDLETINANIKNTGPTSAIQ